MEKNDKRYTETEVALLLSQAVDLGRELKAVLGAAKCAAAAEDHLKTAACMDRANTLMGKIGSLATCATCDGGRTGRPRAGIREGRDTTLGKIRNAQRLGVSAGTLARELGLSESTFRRRLRRSQFLPDNLLFSQIP